MSHNYIKIKEECLEFFCFRHLFFEKNNRRYNSIFIDKSFIILNWFKFFMVVICQGKSFKNERKSMSIMFFIENMSYKKNDFIFFFLFRIFNRKNRVIFKFCFFKNLKINLCLLKIVKRLFTGSLAIKFLNTILL